MPSRPSFFLFSFAALLLGCSSAVDGDDDERLGAASSAAVADLTNPSEGIYWVHPGPGTSFIVDVVGPGNVDCPSGAIAPSCVFDRLSLAGAGLSASQTTQILARLGRQTSETNTSVFLQGRGVTVRDHTTLERYTEFRAVAAFVAPTERAHAEKTFYMPANKSIRGINCFSLTRSICLDRSIRNIGFRLGGEPLPSSRSDIFVSARSATPVPGEGLGRVDVVLDQFFVRWHAP